MLLIKKKKREVGAEAKWEKPPWNSYVHNYIKSSSPDKTKHPWAQSSVEAEYIIKNLTVSEHALVVDPFLGSGAFGIAAVKLGRHFVGIDIDKETLDNAENNIKSVIGSK